MNKKRVFILSMLLCLTSLSGCNDTAQASFSFYHEEYTGDFTAYYREYYSSKTGERIRLFENNYIEYSYQDTVITSVINYCGSYFSMCIDDSSYYYKDGDQHNNVDISVFLFSYSDTEITLLPKYSVSNNHSFKDTKFSFVYEGNTNPPYHYRKQDGDSFEFCYFLNPSIQDQQTAIEVLKITEYSEYCTGFFPSDYFDCSLLYLELPTTGFLNTIERLWSVDKDILYQTPVYYLHSEGNYYYYVNVEYYDLSSSNQIKDAQHLATISGDKFDNKVFNSYEALKEYADQFSASNGSVSKNNLNECINNINQAVFDSNNLVLTKTLVSPVVQECTFYNSCYLKDGILNVVFDSTPFASGFTALSYRAYLIAIPKSYQITGVRILI